MPSLLTVGTTSGLGSGFGMPLVPNNVFSGTAYPIAGILIKNSTSGIGPVYIGVHDLSGSAPTLLSGGSLTSGGMADAMELGRGESYFIPRGRLRMSGQQPGMGPVDLTTIRYHALHSASGSRLFWDTDTRFY